MPQSYTRDKTYKFILIVFSGTSRRFYKDQSGHGGTTMKDENKNLC